MLRTGFISICLLLATVGCRHVVEAESWDDGPGNEGPGYGPDSGLPEGAVLVMHFEEKDGAREFEDSSGYGNDGFCDDDWCPEGGSRGVSGRSLELNGKTEYVTVPHSESLSPEEEITIAAWIHSYGWDGNNRVVQKGDHDDSYRFTVERGELLFHIGDGVNSGVHLVTPLPPTDEWHHLAAVYDGAKMRIWMDGKKIAEADQSGPIPWTDANLHIGTKKPDAPEGDFFGGMFDTLLIYDRALSTEEIRELAGL